MLEKIIKIVENAEKFIKMPTKTSAFRKKVQNSTLLQNMTKQYRTI